MNSALIIPGTVYKLDKGVAVASIGESSIDEAAMTVDAVICTAAIDRQGEVIIPEGVDFSDYVKNPVVLWEHGFDGNITTPIAKAESPDGKLTVTKTNGIIEARSHFTNKDQASAQIFALIVEKIIRATSIHVIPEETERRDDIVIYPKSKMLEFSWGRIGVNPEAVAKLLGRGRLNDEPILESIAKTLQPFAPRAKGNGVGAEFGKGQPVSKTTSNGQPQAGAAKNLPAGGSAAKTDDTTPADDQPVEGEGAGEDQPPSVRVASAVKNALSQLVANVQAAANTYEDPRAKEYLDGAFMEQCKALMTEVDGLISELGGKAAESDTPADEAEAEEAMKTFLAGGSRNRLQVLGIAAPLASLATAKNLKPEQRLQLEGVMKGIRKIVGEAKTVADGAKAKTIVSQAEALKAQNAETQKALDGLQAQLKELESAA